MGMKECERKCRKKWNNCCYFTGDLFSSTHTPIFTRKREGVRDSCTWCRFPGASSPPFPISIPKKEVVNYVCLVPQLYIAMYCAISQTSTSLVQCFSIFNFPQKPNKKLGIGEGRHDAVHLPLANGNQF